MMMKRTRLFSKVASIFLVSLLVTSLSAHIVGAAENFDPGFYAGNDILFYDPTAKAGCGSALNGKDNIEKALNFYMQKGLTLAQAAGIVGNFIAESGVDPRKEEGGKIVDDNYILKDGVGFGIAQWTFTPRQAPLAAFIKSQNVGITDLGGQLGFSWQELQTTHKKAFNSVSIASTPLDAAFAFHRDFEGSADTIDKIIKNRGGNAEKLYEQYKNAPPLTTLSTGSNPTSNDNACSSSGLAEVTLAYAWPNYRGKTLDSKPEWTTAWQKAKAAGFYVGGVIHPGIDCGGFITRLLIDSGFASGYNYGGKGGATTEQEKWLRANWTSLGTGGTVDTATLQPGDVAIKSSLTGQEGHTFVYVGQITGFDSKIASASLDERSPMADTKQNAADNNFTWYRKK